MMYMWSQLLVTVHLPIVTFILFVWRKEFYLTRLKTPIDHHIVFLSFVMSLTYLKHQEIALVTHFVTNGAAI